MCGIAGAFGAVSAHRVEYATRLLSHRGPDGVGLWRSPTGSSCLGHRRLAILDLTDAASQPMISPEGTVAVSFNGEIFNYRELRSLLAGEWTFRSTSDTEVLLAGYREWGLPELLRRLRGMFAIALWDEARQTGFLVRDRLGIKPIYYAIGSGSCCFGSEAKAVLSQLDTAPSIDTCALAGLTAFLWLPDPDTPWVGVKKLEPGHYLEYSGGNAKISCYWDPTLEIGNGPCDPIGVEELAALVDDAISEQMISDVPIGAFLSGGLDSTTIVSRMASQSGPVHTYTIGFCGDDQRFEKADPDRVYARHVADQFGCIHEEIPSDPHIADLLPKLLWHLDEPVSDPAAINTYIIARHAYESGIRVLLSGMGADEVFGGYRKYRAILLLQYLSRTPRWGRRALKLAIHRAPVASASAGLRPLRWARRLANVLDQDTEDAFVSLGSYCNAADLARLCVDTPVRYSDIPNVREMRRAWDRASGLSLTGRMSYVDIKTLLPGLNLAYCDRASMAASVEVRPPFVDHRFVERTLLWTDRQRIKGAIQKSDFRSAVAKWVPREVAWRPKAPFSVPLRSWLRRQLRPMVSDVLSDTNLKRFGVFEPTEVRRIISENDSGRSDNAHLIWALLSITLWHDIAPTVGPGFPSDLTMEIMQTRDASHEENRLPVLLTSALQPAVGGAAAFAQKTLNNPVVQRRCRVAAHQLLKRPSIYVEADRPALRSKVGKAHKVMSGFANLGSYIASLIRNSPKIVHMNYNGPFFGPLVREVQLYRYCARLHGAEFVVRHGSSFQLTLPNLGQRQQEWVRKEYFGKMGGVIYQCSAFRSIVEEFLAGDAPPGIVVPNTVDIDVYSPRPRESDGVVRIGCVLGPDHAAKGARDLLSAVQRVRNAPSVPFRIVAIAADKEQRALIDEFNVGDLCETYGYVTGPEKVRLFQGLDVFALPSREEGFPNVLLEAMACELAVIGTDAGAIPEVLNDGANGRLVRRRQVDELAAALLGVISDKQQRTVLGREARRTVVDRYALSGSWAADLCDFYEYVYARRTPSPQLTAPSQS